MEGHGAQQAFSCGVSQAAMAACDEHFGREREHNCTHGSAYHLTSFTAYMAQASMPAVNALMMATPCLARRCTACTVV